MTIDTCFHPIYFDMIQTSEAELKKREEAFGVHKQSPYTMDEILSEMDYGKIEKSILHPIALTTTENVSIVTNEEISKIIQQEPNRFIGFASVDPNNPEAETELEQAFQKGLAGLTLHPGKQQIYPNDPKMKPLYQLCEKYDKPIYFHSGLSWEPRSYTKFCQPLFVEDVLIEHPALRICLAHFSWPWIQEVMMLMIKYSNLYTDTSMLYLNSFDDFFGDFFSNQLTPSTIERNFPRQIMFGSNTPRFRAFKVKRALEKIPFSKEVRENILTNNAYDYVYGRKSRHDL
ncbi:TPA: amidohydrolase family protein [Enterococcus faecium]|uniref:amidohydrolase family protein n=2 Tax=Enterococcus faecium TaxID=1352 RepID=UPI000453B4D1|nr:amidohydrolase family protein [Enterococcus faecium]MBX8934858.1 amidohydrolase [Enterobacter sp. K62_1]EGP4965800.1 amidohydrolase [Enterococcus faecium]EGP4973506.1 amidohydrolase [Enterococcus faecium]EGP5065427.1 amidohydrolase [Enterococcus faecium]EZP96419.1 hypothetical protein Z971_15135 [Enterococcus faecium VRE0576]